jgi:tripeptide aminopeptidase
MRDAAERAGGSVEIEWVREYGGFSLCEDADAVHTLTEACGSLDLTPRLFSTGGGSDANIIASLGIPTVALSCGMSGVHGTNESIAVADLETLTALCVRVAHEMCGEGSTQ